MASRGTVPAPATAAFFISHSNLGNGHFRDAAAGIIFYGLWDTCAATGTAVQKAFQIGRKIGKLLERAIYRISYITVFISASLA